MDGETVVTASMKSIIGGVSRGSTAICDHHNSCASVTLTSLRKYESSSLQPRTHLRTSLKVSGEDCHYVGRTDVEVFKARRVDLTQRERQPPTLSEMLRSWCKE